jgi:hypothetical protein
MERAISLFARADATMGPHRAIVASAFVSLAAAACLLAGGDEPQGKYLIRHKFWDGQTLKYSIKLGGEGEWTPKEKDMGWGRVTTEFVCTLREKALREKGGCTYEVIGESLKSKAEGPKGVASVTADRSGYELKLGDLELTPEEGNPLTKEMTLTIGPRGGTWFTTGMRHIALFFIVNVDWRFWTALTLAPEKEVGVGDEWETEFEVQLPDSEGEPLKVKAMARVTGWENHRGRRCLAGKVSAVLDLENTSVLLKNGDRINIQKGRYEANGKVMWDVQNGLLCYADASNRLQIISDKPTRRAFQGQARCMLDLLAAK